MNDENLSNINKTKHPKKGENKIQDEGSKFRQKEEIINQGRLQGEHEHIIYSNLADRKGNMNKSNTQTP